MPENEEKFVKIVVDLPEPDMGISGEGLWTVQVGSDLYEVRNSPWHARNINWGDIVRAVPANEQEKPRFVSVVKRSGNRTIHVYNISEEGRARRNEFIAELKRLGASYEHAGGEIYALDFQPDVDINPALRYLENLLELDLLDYRVSECD